MAVAPEHDWPTTETPIGIVQFIGARLWEREQHAGQLARVSPGPWLVDLDGDRARILPAGYNDPTQEVAGWMFIGAPERWDLSAPRHIAGHDPDWTRRDVAVKRVLLQQHHGTHCCIGGQLVMSDPVPCQRLRELAYIEGADHPDYRPEWAPAW